jgi:hypothetical protein
MYELLNSNCNYLQIDELYLTLFPEKIQEAIYNKTPIDHILKQIDILGDLKDLQQSK